MIQLDAITKSYRMGTNEVLALRGISLKVENGDFVSIMGPSGSGKSTLAHILGLLDVPSTGSYQLNGKEVSALSEDALSVLRRDEIGFIFQQFNLLPRMTALENVDLPLLYSKKSDSNERALSLLEKVGLTTRVGHKPNELSGGQQQRVAIARSLINSPRMILADEPTGNLDSISETEIMAILKDLNAQGITVIMVTHEEEIGAQAKRRIRMRDGLIQSDERLLPIGAPTATDVTAKSAQAATSGSDWLAYLRQGLKTLAANKVRTGLSMLGILIGVGSVVAMLALGTGAQKAIEAQLASLGSNLLVLRPGSVRIGGVAQEAGTTTRLALEDGLEIQSKIPDIKDIAPSVTGRGQVTFMNKNWSTQIQGVSTTYARMWAAQPLVGRFFSDDENSVRARVAVIGTTVLRELFGDQSPIGELIKINKVSFQVIGVLPEKGSNGYRDRDDTIVIPLNTAMHRLLGKDYVDAFDIEVKNFEAIPIAQQQILDLLYSKKRVPTSQQQDAFQIRNMADIQEAMSQSSKTMSALLAAIAAISLLVGGIGIMNIMLVSVTERTKEIGLRKAIGARRQDILMQFLAESVVVSVIGGLLGILLGGVASLVLSWITGWATSVSAQSVVVSFLFSAMIGLIFGIYPAKKAARLHPIDALRYE